MQGPRRKKDAALSCAGRDPSAPRCTGEARSSVSLPRDAPRSLIGNRKAMHRS